jgi:hypothetical protein
MAELCSSKVLKSRVIPIPLMPGGERPGHSILHECSETIYHWKNGDNGTFLAVSLHDPWIETCKATLRLDKVDQVLRLFAYSRYL